MTSRLEICAQTWNLVSSTSAGASSGSHGFRTTRFPQNEQGLVLKIRLRSPSLSRSTTVFWSMELVWVSGGIPHNLDKVVLIAFLLRGLSHKTLAMIGKCVDGFCSLREGSSSSENMISWVLSTILLMSSLVSIRGWDRRSKGGCRGVGVLGRGGGIAGGQKARSEKGGRGKGPWQMRVDLTLQKEGKPSIHRGNPTRERENGGMLQESLHAFVGRKSPSDKPKRRKIKKLNYYYREEAAGGPRESEGEMRRHKGGRGNRVRVFSRRETNIKESNGPGQASRFMGLSAMSRPNSKWANHPVGEH
ncbi:hypothetical protein Salat_0235900 [Sesamum alatum]|uniref:Uncharacterized protein n=1 Tax=Sesamum alatum TaxID=300844 RepID=A0AAE1YZK7_9LAMI|nr:hypothetical protein Salat_0235900 [Sesamum alatum]